MSLRTIMYHSTEEGATTGRMHTRSPRRFISLSTKHQTNAFKPNMVGAISRVQTAHE
jgi:hypothetical protein